MRDGGLDTAYVEQLLRRQDALQAEASRVIADLDLMSLLARAGRAEQVGSLVSGLMVWRDIDIGAVSPGLSVDRAWDVIATYRRAPGGHASFVCEREWSPEHVRSSIRRSALLRDPLRDRRSRRLEDRHYVLVD